jgi:hypothetical protein
MSFRRPLDAGQALACIFTGATLRRPFALLLMNKDIIPIQNHSRSNEAKRTNLRIKYNNDYLIQARSPQARPEWCSSPQ